MTRPSSSPSRTWDLQSLSFTCAVPFSPQFKLTTARSLTLWFCCYDLPARKQVHLKVKMVDLEQTLNLLSVLGEPPRQYGALQAADGSKIRVNIEVTDATRPILER